MNTKTVKPEAKLAMELVRQFEELTPFSLRDRKTGKNGVPGWQVLAVNTAKYLKDTYPTPDSALSSKKRLIKELKGFNKSWLLDPATVHSVKTTISHFQETLNLLFTEYQEEVNQTYRERVDKRSSDESRIVVDLTDYLVKAQYVLEKCAEGASKDEVNWQDVSCALALVTGRRQSEIHFSGEFTPVGDYELEFSGQLKGKGRTVDGSKLIEASFTIPTLVKTDLVLAGIRWLDREGKRLDKETGNPDIVNKRWNKYLGQRSKSNWEIIPDEVWKEVDEKDKWSYHKFRGLYFIACIANLGQSASFSSIKRLAPSILGDSDIKAIEPYERVDIKPGSTTKVTDL